MKVSLMGDWEERGEILRVRMMVVWRQDRPVWVALILLLRSPKARV